MLIYVDNKWDRALELWFYCVKEGYIIDFVFECNESFSSAKRKFASNLRRTMLEEIPLWIKMLLMEKGMMHMHPNRMVDYSVKPPHA
jgi:hypothetical protein